MASKGTIELYIHSLSGFTQKTVDLESCTVGRAASNDVSIDDPSLSRQHCSLRSHPSGSIEITDMNSANGTFVNGERVRTRLLSPNDTVFIGQSSIRFAASIKSTDPNTETQELSLNTSKSLATKAIRELIVELFLEQYSSPKSPDLGSVLHATLKGILTATGHNRALVLVPDFQIPGQFKCLESCNANGERLAPHQQNYSRTILREALAHRQAITIINSTEPSTNDRQVSLTNLGACSTLCLPLLPKLSQNNSNPAIPGLIYADSLYHDPSLDEQSFHLLDAISSYASLALSQRLLARDATIDKLTGLLNRSALDLALKDALLQAKRDQTALSVIFVDVDHFKRINDNHGHATGDQVLEELGRFLTQMTRQNDIIGRYGGEEILIVLPKTTEEQTRQLSKRLRGELNKRTFSKKKLRVTASFGIASQQSSNPNDWNMLTEKADEALYYAKNNGRNCAAIWTDKGSEIFTQKPLKS